MTNIARGATQTNATLYRTSGATVAGSDIVVGMALASTANLAMAVVIAPGPMPSRSLNGDRTACN